MTYEFQYLIHLIVSASVGQPAQPPKHEINWERLFDLAEEQQVLPLLDRAMKKSPPLGCQKELADQRLAKVFQSVLAGCARNWAIIALLDEMEQAGIHVYVVKGFVAARNYASPDSRISGDTDICVAPEDEEKTIEFLRERGFSVKLRWENGYHAAATHPKMGLVEIHVQLYDEIVENVWFGKINPDSYIQEPQIRIDTSDGSYYTLGDTDNLLFMTLHMVKHFIESGMSLRMLLDVALFFSKHREKIDQERFWSALKTLNYERLVSAVFWSMIRYAGFQPEDFPGLGDENSAQTELILADLEEGGWLGRKEYSKRKNSWHEYNRQILRKEKSELHYRLYMLQWQHSFKLSTLFPSKKRLAPHYPYVEKYPVLIPYAWLHRLLFRGFALLKSHNLKEPIVFDENEISAVAKQRIAMFRILGMLD